MTQSVLFVKSFLEKEARDRQEAGNNQHGVKEIFPEGTNGQTRDKIGELAGVSGRPKVYRIYEDPDHPLNIACKMQTIWDDEQIAKRKASGVV